MPQSRETLWNNVFCLKLALDEATLSGMMMRQEGRRWQFAGWLRWGLSLSLLLAGALPSLGQTKVQQAKVQQAGKSISGAKPVPAHGGQLTVTGDRDGYVGSGSCAQCHLGISKKFAQTAMGRSMTAITPELANKLASTADVYDERHDRHFEVHAKDGRLYQSEFQTDAQGAEVFRDTHPMDWVIGAGANGFGVLMRRDDYLFQGPLSFYSKAGKWGTSPGYEFYDFGFNRAILPGCISCHSGRPRPVAGTSGKFEKEPFSELAVGCENCHGPGAEHIRAVESGESSEKAKLHKMVNPANLSMELANNICMSCHQSGDVRAYKEGKTYQDFRPGMALDDILSILVVPPSRETPPTADHLEHFYSMTLSKCYRASEKKMGCITCHDPHTEPTHEEAPAYFNAKCMSCHTQQSCKLDVAARQKSTPANSCIGCHMPRRDIQEISHSSATNHRIPARPDQGLPEVAFQQTTAALPDLIHLNPKPGAKEDVVPALTLLQAYGELAGYRQEYGASYLNTLAGLEKSNPENVQVQAALGHRDLRSGKLPEAAEHLHHALRIGPAQGTVYGDLAEATTKLGKPEEGLELLKKAVVLEPFNPALQKSLIVRLIAMKQYPDALAAMEHYLQVFPQDATIRKMFDMARGGPPQ